ncbi:hypothetical protein NEOLI_003405 [Neolecta irregularis DAH-3]|uniref:Uncharacterized protein n=1 Tax=Neolecta irregularis (strain DAH-3) TaxID=1198029 RepID=A0A1U7LP00_NEOID|nr:hypothetical protein NEOLI_003405 [Neolecta irregularis DAH-3]|eukprot:OLL24272.1 hypothetical protein NEOLI_003405 [Neolecta irregularis DAH-3]
MSSANLPRHPHRRSRSPKRHQHHNRSPSPRRKSSQVPDISKHDFDKLHKLFAVYLDRYKKMNIDELGHDEAYSHFKRFVRKWNQGLVEKRYYEMYPSEMPPKANLIRRNSYTVGPSMPTQQDNQLQKERQQELHLYEEQEAQLARKRDRRIQKDRLEELAPKAEPGTRERQLEKKRELNQKLKSFREKSPDGVELKESDIYGDDDFKAKLAISKNAAAQREEMKEDRLREREMEKSVRKKELLTKEEETMKMFKEIAKQRYGR